MNVFLKQNFSIYVLCKFQEDKMVRGYILLMIYIMAIIMFQAAMVSFDVFFSSFDFFYLHVCIA